MSQLVAGARTQAAIGTHFRCGTGRPLPIKCHKSSYGADKNRKTIGDRRCCWCCCCCSCALVWNAARRMNSSFCCFCKFCAARGCCLLLLIACSIYVALRKRVEEHKICFNLKFCLKLQLVCFTLLNIYIKKNLHVAIVLCLNF